MLLPPHLFIPPFPLSSISPLKSSNLQIFKTLIMNPSALLLLSLLIGAAASRNPDPTSGDLFGPGGQFNIPGFGSGNGWGNIGGGYGGGYGGPSGGNSRNGVVRPSVVCADKGPCHNKRLICPAKCFTSYSGAGKGYGGGGGGGGCTIDCKKNCVAYC